MSTLTYGNFRVWFGTDDAPAPAGPVTTGAKVPVCVGVSPPDPDLVLIVRYRRQGGTWVSLPLSAVSGKGTRAVNYYEAVFPSLAPGAVIEYTLLCKYQGRVLKPSEEKIQTFEIMTAARQIRLSTAVTRPLKTPTVRSAPAKEEPTKPSATLTPPSSSAVPLSRTSSNTAKAGGAEDDTTSAGGPVTSRIASPSPGASKSKLISTLKPELVDRVTKANIGVDILRMDVSRDSSDRKSLKLDGLQPGEKKAFIRDIQLNKGVLRAAGDAVVAESLLKKGITTPASVSPARLAKETGIPMAKAIRTHERDIQHYGRLAQGFVALWDARRGGLQNIAVGNLRAEKVDEMFDGLDNIQELFGDQDSCNCAHCNSVLGPVAYFVDLMHFIQVHIIDEKFKDLPNHILHLKKRRPDLWVLPLTRENTYTEIPQLQITAEIFENYIAEQSGKRASADRKEIVSAVYGDILLSGRNSILQPFQLPLEEIEIFLGHFDLRRSDIALLLEESKEIQCRAALGMSSQHAELITIPDETAENILGKLRLELPADGIMPMRQLLDATHISRSELGDLLESRFVSGGLKLTIMSEKKSAESVQADIERVHGMTLRHLDRIHRLLRFKRYVSWTVKEIDGFIASAGGELNAGAVEDAGRALILQRRFRAGIDELCALAGDLPDFPIQKRTGKEGDLCTVIDMLFNVPDLMREDVAYPSPAASYSAGASSSHAKERAMRLRAGLRLSDGDLNALIEGLGNTFEKSTGAGDSSVIASLFARRLKDANPIASPQFAPPIDPMALPSPVESTASFPLTLRNLSLLYRHAVMGRWLKLSPGDLLTLVGLTPGVGNHLTCLADCLAVVRFHEWWKTTSFSLEDLTVLLAPREALDTLVDRFWTALQVWLKEQQSITLAETFLTQVEGVSERLSLQLMKNNMGKVFEAVGDGYRVQESWHNDSDFDFSSAADTDFKREAVLELVRSYHPDARTPRALTELLQVDIGFAKSLVDAALVGKTGISASSLLQEGKIPPSVRPVIEALLKLQRIGSALRLPPVTLRFLADHLDGLGVTSWCAPDSNSLRRVADVQALIKKRYRNEPEKALACFKSLITEPERLFEFAATLLELSPTVTKDLVQNLRMPANPLDALFKLAQYAEKTSKLGIDGKALAALVNEDYALANMAAGALMAGFRAKYPDEATWKEKFEPYQGRVLERKRDALIDYLMRMPGSKFRDTKELYKYFLIDGEVDSCFRTSRVVAASSSLQLYVHRIRMNLEKEPEGGLHVEPSLIPEEEWEWRQHYRVWEANRKIYLWPENYLDPTIRGDKTPLFEALESELLQQEITEQTVIDAYSNYLKSLEELANLRFAGAFHHYTEDEDSGEIADIIYLFGATGGDAPTHYWREVRNLAKSQSDELVSAEFGPWRKVDTRIPVRHVTPVVYDGQLQVFWNEINTTSQNAVNDGKSRFIGYSHRYALKFTSLRLDGQWTPPETISLQGAGEAFAETTNLIDDPLAEQSELKDFQDAFFAQFSPWFGTYHNPGISITEAQSRLLTPRYGIDVHTKAREGYTLSGFMWERPYILPDPSYGHRLLVNCAGFLVRGAVDLFDRQVLRANDTMYKTSASVGSPLLAYRFDLSSLLSYLRHDKGVTKGAPDFALLRRDESNKLKHITWAGCQFDYPVAAALALNARDLNVFQKHWTGFSVPDSSKIVADVPPEAGVWAVTGTPCEVVIETEDDLLLLLPEASGSNRYLLHRLGTSLVRDVARKLFYNGIDGLLSTDHQLGLKEELDPKVLDLKNSKLLTNRIVQNPIANDSSYGIYFQEIFHHIPLLIAHYLNAQGKFEQAQRWYHFVFDPTSPEPPGDTDSPPTDRNWKYRQFRGQEQAKLRDVLSDTAAIQKYREDPFNVHAIARLRVSAYQKSVVMRYIDNLLDWGDERFTRFQMETVNEAMMLYVTAAEVLGPRPLELGDCGELSESTRSYDKLKDSLSKDGEFLLEVEELIPAPPLLLPPPAAGGMVVKPFGIKAILGFPLSEAKAIGDDKAFDFTKGIAIHTAAMADTAIAKPSAEGGVASRAVADAAGAGKGSTSVMAVAGAIAYATAAKTSKGTTGVFAPETTASSGGTSGSSKASAFKGTVAGAGGKALGAPPNSKAITGLAMGIVPFSKAAVAMDRTDSLVKAFALRQQFAFLGGNWKNNGGRRFPSTLGDRFSRAVVRQVAAAFCIPRNEMLDGYWNRVEDRIQKIRTCRDITGQKRKLSLFAPPIDPMLLARARAAGIPLDDALGALAGMIPLYRFSYLLGKAKEFAGTVQSFGAALQSGLERKDSEELVRLQAAQQQQILALTTRAKAWELEAAQANLEAAERHRTAVTNRQIHYAELLSTGLNEWEVLQGVSTHTASVIKGGSTTLHFLAAGLGIIPQIGSPFAMKFGGEELHKLPANIANGIDTLGEIASLVASSAALEAGWDRRSEDWTFQRDQARDELSQIEKQIEASRIGRTLAEHAIKLHDKNIAQNEELLEYHEDKFSNLGLYTWLASQLQRTYRDAYNMALRMARYAEQAYRFEREDYTSELLSGQYWDAPHAGLLAGNKLTLDLQALEQRYIDTDLPKRELVDHVFSLRQWDPRALIALRQKGECSFKVPELFFDLASPGDYRRRLRSIRVTIPAVAGPYVNIMATLSLLRSEIRPDPRSDLQEAPRPRVESISTSSARNDAGSFEINFRGEKYVPFEGAGAVSEWALSLPTAVRMFNYDTISDVILHFDYTASFDGLYREVVQGVSSGIVSSVQERLASDGIVRAFNLKEEFPAQFFSLASSQTTEIEITQDHLPFFLRFANVKDATLAFTDIPEDSLSVGVVEFDGQPLGTPNNDEQLGGVSIPLTIRGSGPWKHRIRVDSVSKDISMWMIIRFTAS